MLNAATGEGGDAAPKRWVCTLQERLHSGEGMHLAQLEQLSALCKPEGRIARAPAARSVVLRLRWPRSVVRVSTRRKGHSQGKRI